MPGVARCHVRLGAYGMLGFPFFSMTPIGQHSAEPSYRA